MTRVLIVCLVICSCMSSKVKIPSSDPSEELYQSALSLLETYNSHTTNLTQVLDYLENSASSQNYDAMAKLGEFYFLGFPVSPDNPDQNPAFLNSNGMFKRDFKKAAAYFKQAYKGGSKDAPFYLALLLQQTLLIEDYDTYLPNYVDLESSISHLYNIAMERGSPPARSALASSYIQCISSINKPVPSFLANHTGLHYYTAPFFDDIYCGGSCEDLALKALSVANDAITHIKKMGGEGVQIGRLDAEEENLFGEETQKALMLANAHIEKTGNQYGYLELAEYHMFGNPYLGIERNIPEAIHYFELAAQQGNLNAMESLGVIYAKGIGVERNTTRALELLNTAAVKGSAQAYNGLGYIYWQGIGVNKDSKKAFEFMKKAADKGHLESLCNMGVFYLNGDGVIQDYRQALLYFELASAGGYADGMFNLGVMHLYGLGVKKSCRTALSLFMEVLKKGELSAIVSKAYSFYRSGDYEGAYLLYSLGSSLGFENAQLSAGYMWEKQTVPYKCRADPIQCAGQFYTKAAHSHGSEWAYLNLADISYSGGSNFAANYTEAYEYYTRSINNPQSLFTLAYMTEQGLGVARNYSMAEELYQSLIDGAETGEYDWEAKYPAMISLYKLKAMEYIESVPILHEGWKYVEEMMRSIFSDIAIVI
jgi:SEL1 protein